MPCPQNKAGCSKAQQPSLVHLETAYVSCSLFAARQGHVIRTRIAHLVFTARARKYVRRPGRITATKTHAALAMPVRVFLFWWNWGRSKWSGLCFSGLVMLATGVRVIAYLWRIYYITLYERSALAICVCSICHLYMHNANLTRTVVSQNATGMTKWVARLDWFAVGTTAVDFTSKLYLPASHHLRTVARSQVHAYASIA